MVLGENNPLGTLSGMPTRWGGNASFIFCIFLHLSRLAEVAFFCIFCIFLCKLKILGGVTPKNGPFRGGFGLEKYGKSWDFGGVFPGFMRFSEEILACVPIKYATVSQKYQNTPKTCNLWHNLPIYWELACIFGVSGAFWAYLR